jgi:hypothetical protein
MSKQSKILLYGLGAVGKSFSTATLFKLQEIRPEQRVIYLCTERNAISGLSKGLLHHKIDLKEGQLYTSVIRPKSKKSFANDVSALTKYVKQSASQSQQSDQSNMDKDKYTMFLDIMNGLQSFIGTDYVTKQEVKLGNVGDLTDDDILVIDGLSPITHAIWQITKGSRVGGQMSDYGTVQYWIKQFTTNLIELECSVILLAHADKIIDDIEKVEKMRVSLDAGVALAGKYCGNWGDVIYAYMTNAGKRVWAGKKLGVEVAARNFPEEDNLEQDFSLYNFFRYDGKN